MASNKIPDPMTKRHLLEKPMDATQAIALAEAYLEQDREVDALDFLAKAGATDELESLAERAIAAGDAFLFKSILEIQGVEEPPSERWDRLAAVAEAAGKTLYASLARRTSNSPQSD